MSTAFTLQLSDAKSDLGIQAVAGACSNSADFLSLINTVTRRLLKRGSFYETDWLIKICFTGCKIRWPEIVGTVQGVRFCGKSEQAALRNNWWSIIGTRSCYSNWQSDVTIQEGNSSPVVNDITGNEGKLIRYHVVKAADYGKKIWIYGTAFGGQPLQRLESGVWVDGIEITAANPFGTNAVLVQTITSIVREATVGMTYLYAYDSVADQLFDLASFTPNQTNPRFRTSIVKNICAVPSCETDDGVRMRTAEALIKINYRPLVNDSDFLIISDLDALALGIQSLKREQANDIVGSQQMMAAAISELNFGTREKEPELQTSIRLNVWGDGGGVMYNPI